ncbi:unnamed protein product [Choristocarpus tenellus]
MVFFSPLLTFVIMMLPYVVSLVPAARGWDVGLTSQLLITTSQPRGYQGFRIREIKRKCSDMTGIEKEGVGCKRTCRECKSTYLDEENFSTSCRFHKGRWMGAERSKHYGTRSGGRLLGLESFWDCCGATSADAPGCMTGRHRSYDDVEDVDVFVSGGVTSK